MNTEKLAQDQDDITALKALDNKFCPINDLELVKGGEVLRFSKYSWNKNGQIAYDHFGQNMLIEPHKIGGIAKVFMTDDNGTKHEINVITIIACKKAGGNRERIDLDTWQNYAINEDVQIDNVGFSGARFYRLPKADTLAEVVSLLRSKKNDPWNNAQLEKFELYLRDIVYIETGRYPTETLLPTEDDKSANKVVPLNAIATTSPEATVESVPVPETMAVSEHVKGVTFRKSPNKLTASQEQAAVTAYFVHDWYNKTLLGAIAGVADSTVGRLLRDCENNPNMVKKFGLDPSIVMEHKKKRNKNKM